MGPYISFYDSIVGRGGREECTVLHAHTSLSRRSGNGNNISISHHAAAAKANNMRENTHLKRQIDDGLTCGKITRKFDKKITDKNIVWVHRHAFV